MHWRDNAGVWTRLGQFPDEKYRAIECAGTPKKVCRECGRIYLRRYVRTSGALRSCGPRCFLKSYSRQRKGKGAGQPPSPIDDSAIPYPRVIDATVLAILNGPKSTAHESLSFPHLIESAE